jgi:hypothetical protein
MVQRTSDEASPHKRRWLLAMAAGLIALCAGISPIWGISASSAAPAFFDTLGNTHRGGAAAALIANRKRVNSYALPVSAEVSSLNVYLSATPASRRASPHRRRHATQVLRGVIYGDSGGRPGALLGSSNALRFSSTDSSGWYALAFPAPLHLSAGNYWIGILAGGQSAVAAYRYDRGSGVSAEGTNAYARGPANPFGPLSTDARRISLYANYVADAAPAPVAPMPGLSVPAPAASFVQSLGEAIPPAEPIAPVSSGLPVVSGVAEVGQVLSAGDGVWSGSPSGFAFQWLRCDSSGGGCVSIGLATVSSYTVVSGDVGHTLRVQVVASNGVGSSAPAESVQTAVVTAPPTSQHLEYVFEDGTISVYDMDNGYKLVKTISLPQTNTGVRGVTVAPSTHLLFISYGGDGGVFGTGSVLAYDLVTNKVVWTVNLKTGIDSGQVSPDGTRLYMPTGENDSSGIWNILNTTNGAVIGTIQGGAAAHNTVVSNNGRYVYLGGHNSNFLDVYDTTTSKVVKEVGPLEAGVRPFTVNGSNTLAFTSETNLDGFQVSSITTGKVLFTVRFATVPKGFPFTGPSHGVSLSPDEKQLYVIDSVNKEVRVYDVSEVAKGVAPSLLGVIPVAGLTGEEKACAYDCGRGGWLQRSVDGRFVFVGDSGEVIETATRKVIATLPTLLNTKKSLEVDWEGGLPVATSNRTGVGEVG